MMDKDFIIRTPANGTNPGPTKLYWRGEPWDEETHYRTVIEELAPWVREEMAKLILHGARFRFLEPQGFYDDVPQRVSAYNGDHGRWIFRTAEEGLIAVEDSDNLAGIINKAKAWYEQQDRKERFDAQRQA